MVLWRQSDAAALIGIAETSFDPPQPGPSRARFHAAGHAAREAWTGYVWPAPFMPGELTIDDLRARRQPRRGQRGVAAFWPRRDSPAV